MSEQFLDVSDVEQICFEYARTTLGFNEPLPPFNTRFPGKLEAALAAPQRTVGDQFLYPTFEDRAAVLFYEVCKVHPFVNGNKRMALVSLMAYLAMNDKWIVISHNALYRIAIDVASSQPKNREVVLKSLSDFIRRSIQPFSTTESITEQAA